MRREDDDDSNQREHLFLLPFASNFSHFLLFLSLSLLQTFLAFQTIVIIGGSSVCTTHQTWSILFQHVLSCKRRTGREKERERERTTFLFLFFGHRQSVEWINHQTLWTDTVQNVFFPSFEFSLSCSFPSLYIFFSLSLLLSIFLSWILSLSLFSSLSSTLGSERQDLERRSFSPVMIPLLHYFQFSNSRRGRKREREGKEDFVVSRIFRTG